MGGKLAGMKPGDYDEYFDGLGKLLAAYTCWVSVFDAEFTFWEREMDAAVKLDEQALKDDSEPAKFDPPHLAKALTDHADQAGPIPCCTSAQVQALQTQDGDAAAADPIARADFMFLKHSKYIKAGLPDSF